ncbi:General amino acid permease [Mycena chlorophos]|uniref:General amino acid permease n=1 Tax=Mycena chlorophos TaxID=658473 RepID=A0A8H6SL51_MYCCL|nr:General amino acid permease [Mycena chlorophos]
MHPSPVRAREADEPDAEKSSGRSPTTGSDMGSTLEDHTHRTLQPRHIQLISIGGAIGTVLFVQIGVGLADSGPATLLLAFLLWSTVVIGVNSCLAEMVCWIPISSPYIRFADRFVDEALGMCSGVNWFLSISLGVPFEISAFNLMLRYWTDKVPVEVVIVAMSVAYTALNIFAVRYYGESEFWLSIGKVVLIVGLLVFTFIAMLGGNPLHDRFGFRNWTVPGAPFASYGTAHASPAGHFFAFLSAMGQAVFTICGPEYLSITAGEAASPRRTLPLCFRSTVVRLILFFVLGALAVGVLVPYSDPGLVGGGGGSAGSPYVLALTRLHLSPIASLVNAAVMLSIFSAGNSYVYNASRTLYGLALEGRAPRVFARCSKGGVPVYCVAAVMLFAGLAFLEVGRGSGVVLMWITRFGTMSGLANYAMISFTYLRFAKALRVQNIPRETSSQLNKTLPWRPSLRLQIFYAYYALGACIIMCLLSGYAVFLPGHWDPLSFVFSYVLWVVLPLVFVGWKIYRKTKWRSPEDVDLFTAEREVIDREELELEAEEQGEK